MSKKEERDFLKKLTEEAMKVFEENPNMTEDEFTTQVLKNMFPDMDEENFWDEESLDEQTKKEMEAEDLLQEAYQAINEKDAKKYAKQALKLNPNLIDAESFLIEFEDNLEKRLEKYEALKEKAKKLLEEDEEEEYFSPENVGIFWGLIETRPYMRVCHSYMLTLMHLGRYTKAIEQGEEMLLLCESDNMGIRDLLMHLYAMLERFEDAEKLYQRYQEATNVSMLFPLAIMYYRKGDFKKVKEIIPKIQKSNQHVLKMLIKMSNNQELNIEELSKDKYIEVGSKQEAFSVIEDNIVLIATVPMYPQFIKECLEENVTKGKGNIKRIK